MLGLMSFSAARIVDPTVEASHDEYQRRLFSAIQEGLADEAARRFIDGDELDRMIDERYAGSDNSDG